MFLWHMPTATQFDVHCFILNVMFFTFPPFSMSGSIMANLYPAEFWLFTTWSEITLMSACFSVFENLKLVFFHKFWAFTLVWIEAWYYVSFLLTSSMFFLIIVLIYSFEALTEAIKSASVIESSVSVSGFGSMATIFLTDSLKSWTFLGAVMVSKALSI